MERKLTLQPRLDLDEEAALRKTQQEKLAKVAAWKEATLQKKIFTAQESTAASIAAASPTVSQPTSVIESPASVKAQVQHSAPASAHAKFDPKAIKKQTGGNKKFDHATLDNNAPFVDQSNREHRASTRAAQAPIGTLYLLPSTA